MLYEVTEGFRSFSSKVMFLHDTFTDVTKSPQIK